MSLERKDRIVSFIERISFVEIIEGFEQEGFELRGKIALKHLDLNEPLHFKVIIQDQYPFRIRDFESIKFLNKELIPYNHVMPNGQVCIHTSHSTNLKNKIFMDFNSLRNWVSRYMVNKEEDNHYEHIVVPEFEINNGYFSYLFSEVNNQIFVPGDYGYAVSSELLVGSRNGKLVTNNILQEFFLERGEHVSVKWGWHYKNLKTTDGVFYFSETPPAIHGRIAFDDWSQIDTIVSSDFLNFLHSFERDNVKKYKGSYLPVFIGYKLPNHEIHWETIMLKIGSFPIKGEPVFKDGRKTRKWKSVSIPQSLNWAITRNASPKYFYGRGTLSEEIVSSKVLMIGIGAIGSIVSKTLVRGGVGEIDLVDYDIKYPENICRSEYLFSQGICDKADELTKILYEISPHVSIHKLNNAYFDQVSKVLHNDRESKRKFEGFLNEYDMIIDCSTDDDLMFLLNSLELSCKLINISITNHSKDLVCAFYPNIYNFVRTQFDSILDNDTEDLYNPTGCWSPTFKAGYNDINSLVQYAVRQIDVMAKNGRSDNFVLSTSVDSGNFEIKLNLY